MTTVSLPIICTLNPSEFHQRRTHVLQKLKTHVKEQTSLPNGYAWRFEGSDERLEDLLEILRLERDCCAFLTMKITTEPNKGPLWLELTGPDDAKAFISQEMGLVS